VKFVVYWKIFTGFVSKCLPFHQDFMTFVGFQVLTAASMNITAFWNIAPCSVVEVARRFRGMHCLHHHSSPWWWRQHAPLKRRPTSRRLLGATSQKLTSSHSTPLEPEISQALFFSFYLSVFISLFIISYCIQCFIY
jgi:hypothetical protein